VKRLQGPGAFKVKTPIGVASVRGTEFEVEFIEEGQEMSVEVLKGSVGISKLGEEAQEVIINSGERIKFGIEGEIGNPIRFGAVPLNRIDVRNEVQIAKVKESVIAQAAEESRNADYQVGKTMMDVDGKRVRIEEYIMRPAANQFKLVVLNHRESRFDYFTYRGTFNTNLPDDLSLALQEVNGKLSLTAPTYYLTGYEMYMSNTRDYITDTGTGGHLVKITYDGTNYTLTDNADGANTKTIEVAQLQGDGTYKIYNPLRDTFSYVSAAQLTEGKKISVLDPVSGNYKNLESGDTYWKTRFNSYTYYINTTLKESYSKSNSVTNVLSLLTVNSQSDIAWGQDPPYQTIQTTPSGSDKLHNRLNLYYKDVNDVETRTIIDTYIIDDDGNIGDRSSFSGLSTSAAYKTELLKWNYQQKIKATEMSDEINLVVDPRIGTMSGLMQ
ncbi:MAG: FecR domain-containing protein, partial [Elusimicrobia bacterium]|nr:FecR domain-containing protein [Candidatus Obscuribacterium magneticum]MCB4755501.1 FecR domain-containing protein [Candidatus Obscuribacterium magneticum]